MDYIVEMLHITKQFPGVVANDDVTLQVKKGEIHALLGENGAGKSTLMSVLFGMYQPEKGSIRLKGKEVSILNPRDANDFGIGMVHQHFMLVHNLTVLQNIILGVETVSKGLLDLKTTRGRVVALSEKYNLKVDPDALISDISVGMQQRVEILKMLYRQNELLILDEPTAVLTPQEIEELMKVMRGLVAEGKSIIFITHKLNEILEVADRCTVLRRGKMIGTVDVASTTKEELSEMMVGRRVELNIEKGEAHPGETILNVRDLVVKSKRHGLEKNVVNHVNFDVKRGEIVCIAGIEGNGQSELVYALTGLIPADAGEIVLLGKNVKNDTVRFRNMHGLSHIPEDRHKHGLILDYTLGENLVMQSYFTDHFQNHGVLKKNRINEYAEKLIGEYDIRSGQGASTIARSMSGGNQQKAIVAREIDKNPDLLIAVQPTRGLDVGAIEYIHKKLVEQRDKGKAVLLISLELDEVMNLADRILVIYEGEIVGGLDPKRITLQELGLYMAGSVRDEVV